VDPDVRARLDETMTQIAGQTDATLHVYHHPGRAARRVVLRDVRNDRGTQFEAAQLDNDGTLQVTGHHTGPGVSEFFGDAITCYDWAYVIAPDRVEPWSLCWAATPATMCSTCWPPITTSTAGRSTIFYGALKSPPRSATGIANSLISQGPQYPSPGIRGGIDAEQRVVVFVGLRTQPDELQL